MTELELAAMVFADSFKLSELYLPEDFRTAFVESFEAGAQWKAEQSPWISVEERLPEDDQLVLTSSGIYGTKLLEWNTSHALWFHEGGDDAYCEKEKIDAWMPIPE